MAGETGLALVRKSVEVLDALAVAGEASAADLASQLGEPRSSMYRLLASLHSLGMVETGARKGTYRLGFKLLSLGSAVAGQFDERRLALPVMERLHAETGETVFLCVRRGQQGVCIERLDGRRVQSLALKLGGALPLHAGAASRALLSGAPDYWDEYLAAGPLERFTPYTINEPAALRKALEMTRRTGIAVSDQDVTVGVAALGVPVKDYRGRVRCALSISGIRETVLGQEQDRYRALLLQAGEEVSAAMGAALAGTVADLG